MTDKIDDKDQKKSKRSVAVDQMEGTMYLLTWQGRVLDTYSNRLSDVYITPLSEHCLKKKPKGKSSEDQAKAEQNQLREKLDKALKKLTDWDSDDEGEEYGESPVTLGELTVMYRLRTLVDMMKELVKLNKRLIDWMFKNIMKLHAHASELELLLKYACFSFEAISSIAEIFKFEPIDRTQCSDKFKKFVRAQDKDEKGWTKLDKLEIKSTPREYVKPLEARTNYLRHIVYICANSLLHELQGIFHAVSVSEVELKTSEVKALIDRLPPPFMFAVELRLSVFVGRILSDPPTGRRTAPLAPYTGDMATTPTFGSSHETRRSQSAKSNRAKFNNPLKTSTSKRGSQRKPKKFSSKKK